MLASNTTIAEPCGGERARRGKALVVDDQPINQRLLKRMLGIKGFTVIAASSGEEGLRLFVRERPDIILMDVVMPGMGGIETARRIKAISAEDFVPIIFLTALDDATTMLECIQAGGDDFLTKPIDLALLEARIVAAERVRDLQRDIAASGAPLAAMLEREHQEHLLAERVFSRAIYNRNVAIDALSVMQRSSATFSGDLVLSQHLPDGGVRILVADITGHGLGATIGALPVAEAFHAMTIKGVDDWIVLEEINRKLHGVFPADRFMSAFLVTLSATGQRLRWWNGGMPSGWLRTRYGRVELASHALPLGVVAQLSATDAPREIRVETGDGLLLCTDGLCSALDRAGNAFGETQIDVALARWEHGQSLFPALADAFDAQCDDGGPPHDDAALLELACDPALLGSEQLLAARAVEVQRVPDGRWAWSVELCDRQLARLRSVRSMLGPLGLLEGLEPYSEILETLVSELYDNAWTRDTARTREPCARAHCMTASNAAADGDQVADCNNPARLTIEYAPLPQGGRFIVRLDTDGAMRADPTTQEPPAGPRAEVGTILPDLCESLEYSADGRIVEARYVW